MKSYNPRPDTHASRILAVLQERPEGASDAEIAQILRVRHQIVNGECHKLESAGLLERESHGGPLINRLQPDGSAILAASVEEPEPSNWFWEGSVQETVASHLDLLGWKILRKANTATHEHGKDIEAVRGNVTLWVTVKGYPQGTTRTRADTQAQHSFAGALYDVVRWRQEDSGVRIAVALPSYPKYHEWRERTRWLESAAPFSYLWVTETGDVQGGLDVT
jgi:hypothetical protein